MQHYLTKNIAMQRLEIENMTANEFLGAISDLKNEVSTLRDELAQHTAQPPTASEKENMTIKEVCNFLRINAVTCWKWTKNGRLTAYRLGSKKYYKRSEVQTVLNNAKTI